MPPWSWPLCMTPSGAVNLPYVCCIRFCGDERLSKRSHHAGEALAASVFTGSFSWRKEMRPTEAG